MLVWAEDVVPRHLVKTVSGICEIGVVAKLKIGEEVFYG